MLRIPLEGLCQDSRCRLRLCCAVSPVGIAQENGGTQTQVAAASPQTVSVPASEMIGMMDHKVLPQYPKEALMKGIQGDVVFNIVVDESGKIVSRKLVSGDPLLVAASEDAIRQYQLPSLHGRWQSGSS